MLTAIIAALVTWYATKVYYTRSLRVEIDGIDNDKLTRARCSKCSRITFVGIENLRTPLYCSMCR